MNGAAARAQEKIRLIIDDLTPEISWGISLDDEDRSWLKSISELSPEPYIVRAQLEVNHEPTIEPILLQDLEGWRANRYIGEIHHQGRILEIKPRLGIETITGWISSILNVQVLPQSAKHSDSSSNVVTQLLAAIWRATVISAGQHALPRKSEKLTDAGYTVRGRLDIAATARRRSMGYRDLVSTRTVRGYNTAPARAVVLADRYFDHHISGDRWRGPRLQDQLTLLRNATGTRPDLPTLSEIRKAKYNPITVKWQRAAELSWRILREDPLGSVPENDSTYGVLIDVAELWELFVLHCAGLASEGVVRHGTSEHASGYLARSTINPSRIMGKLYPDVMFGEDPIEALLDAKYKRLSGRRGVDREDLYQLHAYASTFNAPIAALAYPATSTKIPDQEKLGPWESNTSLLSFLSLPTNEVSCVNKLAAWLSGGRTIN